MPSKKEKEKEKRIKRTVKFIFTIVAVLFATYFYPKIADKLNIDSPIDKIELDGNMQVHFIDVGQGDASLIIAPDGTSMLIDTGPNYSEAKLISYLDAQDISVIDYAVFTHPHEDHIGNADKVLEKYQVKNVIMPDVVHNTSTFSRLLDMIEKEGCEITVPNVKDTFTFGGVKVTILGPIKIDQDDLNECSIVLRTEYGDNSFIFTGDAGEPSETLILKSFNKSDLKSDVIKIGHHGSHTSSSKKFIEAVAPEYSVIQCEKGNDYGHPHRETLDLLKSMSINILRNDIDSNIVFKSDGKQVILVK